ncbi:MAG: hypothetical protein IJ859_09600 [Synergistaceae bacterium]|nr:hypothetical protein [Synergistaceae bacterium]
MSFIVTKNINGRKYLYEITSYRDNGKVKKKSKCLGRLDENGELTASKKKSAQSTEGRSGGNSPEDDRNEIRDKAEEKEEKPVKSEAYRQLPAVKPLQHMFSGKATNVLGRAKTKGEFDIATRTLNIEGVNIFTSESIQNIGVGTAKIFRYAVAEFTKRNSSNAKGNKANCRILLDVKDFATANGVKTTSNDAMKNFRRKLKNSLNILLTSNITWTEKIKGQERNYSGMNYIGKYDLKGNSLRIEFTISMAEYLTSLPLINYPRSLYKLDDRDYNAFAIGEAMCIHYSQDNNVIRQTEGKLRVETILKCTSFPTYDELKEHRWSWEAHVKELFENALDKLIECGFLKDWRYCYSGGIEITDQEIRAGAIDNYEKFISLILKFELNDYETSKIRTIEIQEKKAEKIKKLQIKQKNKKNTDNN